MAEPQHLYHLVVPAQWTDNATYVPPSLASEGFIHLSTKEQLLGSAKRFFADEERVLLIEIAPEKLQAEILYEEADGAHFPHLYGPLNHEAVISVRPLARDGEGHFLPPWSI